MIPEGERVRGLEKKFGQKIDKIDCHFERKKIAVIPSATERGAAGRSY